MTGTDDEAIPSGLPPESGPLGLEGLPRVDAGTLEMSLPGLVESAIQGTLVLTRNGSDVFVLMPVDAYHRLWASTPRPPLIDLADGAGG